jgi:hypothetical protein
MRRITGWIIGGLVTMALWIPSAGAQDGRQMSQGMRHDWRNTRQDRPASNYQTLPADRQGLQRDRTELRTGRQDVWREMHQDRQNIRRDWRDIQDGRYRLWQDRRAGNYQALARDRASLWRDRAQLRADRRELWHDWRNVYRDRYSRW